MRAGLIPQETIMKRVGILEATCLAVAVLTVTAQGNSIKTRDSYGNGLGGEFTVWVFTPAIYAPSGPKVLDTFNVPPASLFQTFCVETNEYLSHGTEYDWDLNDKAVLGGAGGPDPDPLNFKTAYLFSQFWAGTLSNYMFDQSTLANRNERIADATALQEVLWALEQENGTNEAWLQGLGAADQRRIWYEEAVAAAWTDIGNVRVLNLWHYGSLERHEDQDLLIVVPTPQASLAGIGLLGSMLGFVTIRRRRSNQDEVG